MLKENTLFIYLIIFTNGDQWQNEVKVVQNIMGEVQNKTTKDTTQQSKTLFSDLQVLERNLVPAEVRARFSVVELTSWLIYKIHRRCYTFNIAFSLQNESPCKHY